MAIKFACECGKTFSVADELVGRRGKCAACGRPTVVPNLSALRASGLPVLPHRSLDVNGKSVERQTSNLQPPALHESEMKPASNEPGPLPTKSRSLSPVWITVGVLNISIVVAAAYIAGFFRPQPFKWSSFATRPAPKAKSVVRPLTTREVVERSEASVARITGKSGSGTGFLVGKKHLATNSHVIKLEFSKDLEVTFPSAPKNLAGPLRAKVLYEDPTRDLALLEIDTELTPLEIGTSYSFHRGDDVTIIGNPGLGGETTLQNAITRGVMSTETEIEGRKYYQLGASVNPGNSGGPVFGPDGKVVGVVASRATKVEAVGFCIPVQDLV